MEDKKIIQPNDEVKDETLDRVAGGCGGAPKPTAAPCVESKKAEPVGYGKRL